FGSSELSSSPLDFLQKSGYGEQEGGILDENNIKEYFNRTFVGSLLSFLAPSIFFAHADMQMPSELKRLSKFTVRSPA
ncbi:hypothetical protein, partial [Chamaesiphon sp. OTE_8_metabat_110]|uniref:hypothetical protein n=1 Tax=Chamaesiphon sp. OTE_8_metabat_110 TaxID=2964696 RepID=UPI002869F155